MYQIYISLILIRQELILDLAPLPVFIKKPCRLQFHDSADVLKHGSQVFHVVRFGLPLWPIALRQLDQSGAAQKHMPVMTKILFAQTG